VVKTAKDRNIVKLAFNKITDNSILMKLSDEASGKAIKLATQIRLGRENWNNAALKAMQGELTIGDVFGAIALFPQDNVVDSVADELCMAYIRKGNISQVPELIEVLNLYGTKKLAENYLNCGQGELGSAAQEWARKQGYNIVSGSGSHRASWGSQ
jgi:hypothetical protein